MASPSVGDRWQLNGTDPGTYHITYVDDGIVHLVDVHTGYELPPYPLEMMNLPMWTKVGFAEDYFCPRCEENPKAEGDYLCHKCRYG